MVMNINFYLKLLVSMFTITSYCCATLVDTIEDIVLYILEYL